MSSFWVSFIWLCCKLIVGQLLCQLRDREQHAFDIETYWTETPRESLLLMKAQLGVLFQSVKQDDFRARRPRVIENVFRSATRRRCVHIRGMPSRQPVMVRQWSRLQAYTVIISTFQCSSTSVHEDHMHASQTITSRRVGPRLEPVAGPHTTHTHKQTDM